MTTDQLGEVSKYTLSVLLSVSLKNSESYEDVVFPVEDDFCVFYFFENSLKQIF